MSMCKIFITGRLFYSPHSKTLTLLVLSCFLTCRVIPSAPIFCSTNISSLSISAKIYPSTVATQHTILSRITLIHTTAVSIFFSSLIRSIDYFINVLLNSGSFSAMYTSWMLTLFLILILQLGALSQEILMDLAQLLKHLCFMNSLFFFGFFR